MEIAAADRNTALAELDMLQNDLLARLDDLDRRVCLVLKEWTAVRQPVEPPPTVRQPEGPASVLIPVDSGVPIG